MKQSELMADEGYYYESRFGCKLCSKRFPCGKSLGAHARSHHVAPPNYFAESDDFVPESDSKINYALRENPKKTWRAEISSRIPPPPPSPHGRICKQCGKGFQSMKALCGHMACHSEKEKNVKDDSSWTSENQKAALEYSCSDSEEAEGKRMKTRSSATKNKRFKKFGEKSPLFLLNSGDNVNNNKVNVNNGSSSVSEIDWDDQVEEVAMCLMLLSRDFTNSNNNNYSVVESSDNNSVVLETNKSSSMEKRSGTDEKLKGKQDTLDVESDSDSGYFLDECTKANSCLLFDGFRNYSAYFGDLRTGSSEKDRAHGDDSRKYECFNCKKAFKSYQALGGHRPCHKRTVGAFYEPRYESGENSLEDSTNYRKKQSAKKNKAIAITAATTTTTNKGKSHVCPFCDRVFKNGQALGGHKRSHFIGGGNLESGIHARPKGRDLLDLNLPAPEADGF